MAVIDPTTDIGRMRLKLGDTTDIQQLADAVYTQTLIDTQYSDGTNNLKEAISICGQYILAQLSFNCHQKIQLLEVFGSEIFNNYKSYLMMIVANPNFNGVNPIIYVAGADCLHPILQHQQDFNDAERKPTSDERLHSIAQGGPFDPYSGDFLI